MNAYRKLVTLLLCLLLVLSMAGCSQKGGKKSGEMSWPLADPSKRYGTVFGQGEVIDICIDMPEESWKELQENAAKEEYYKADITVNGKKLKNVGFRTKGFSSLNTVVDSDSNRYGFKIKTDEYVKGQTLNGLDMFVLNGSFADPSYMREYLTYAASQVLDCKTPYLAYTNVYLNGELFGFYLCVEAYDDSFVERVTGAADSVLYKADSENCTLLPSDTGSGFDIDYGDDPEKAHIRELITVLNATTKDNNQTLENMLDIDSVLKAIAVNTVTGNYDSYSGSKAHNYYLLYSGGKFHYIGWDYNMSFGGFSEDNGSSVQVPLSSPVHNVDIAKRPLIQKLLAIPEYNERYLGYIQQLTTYFADAKSMIASLAETLRPYIKADPSAFYTIDQFESNITESGEDLSKKSTASPGGGGGMPQGNPGQTPPSLPDGQTMPSMPQGNPGQTPPSSPDGQTMPSAPQGNPGQTPPSLPDGQTMPSAPQGNPGQTPPSSPDGQTMPSMPQDNPGQGGMITQNTVSLMDYIVQRINNIQSQQTQGNS